MSLRVRSSPFSTQAHSRWHQARSPTGHGKPQARRLVLARAAGIEDQINSNGFFTDAFKAALAEAVSRQSEPGPSDGDYEQYEQYEDNGNGVHHEMLNHRARVEEVSTSEEILQTALQQCQSNLRSFTIMAQQLEAVIDREKRQLERIHFALEKCRMDKSYYKTLEVLSEARRPGP